MIWTSHQLGFEARKLKVHLQAPIQGKGEMFVKLALNSYRYVGTPAATRSLETNCEGQTKAMTVYAKASV